MYNCYFSESHDLKKECKFIAIPNKDGTKHLFRCTALIKDSKKWSTKRYLNKYRDARLIHSFEEMPKLYTSTGVIMELVHHINDVRGKVDESFAEIDWITEFLEDAFDMDEEWDDEDDEKFLDEVDDSVEILANLQSRINEFKEKMNSLLDESVSYPEKQKEIYDSMRKTQENINLLELKKKEF